MATVSLQSLIDKAASKHSIPRNEITEMCNRGFIAPVPGLNLYDDYFVSEDEVFNKLYNEYSETKEYLTPHQLSVELMEQGIDIPSSALEKMAMSSDLEAYRIASTNRFLFSPDILLNVENIKAAFVEFEEREEQEELDEAELFSDEVNPQDKQADDSANTLPDEDLTEEFIDDEVPTKKKKSRSTSYQPENTYIPPTVPEVSPYAPDAQPQAAYQPSAEHTSGSAPVTSDSGSYVVPPTPQYTPSNNGGNYIPPTTQYQPNTGEPASVHPSAQQYQPTPPIQPNSPTPPTSIGQPSEFGSPITTPIVASGEKTPNTPPSGFASDKYNDYLKQQESERLKEEAYRATSQPTAAPTHTAPDTPQPAAGPSRDASGGFVFGGYAKGEEYAPPPPPKTSEPLFAATMDYIDKSDSHAPHNPKYNPPADDFVVKAQVAEIASQNTLSKAAILDTINYVQHNNETINIPMADGSYLKVEPVPQSTVTDSKSDYRVSLVEHDVDATSTKQTVIYSSEPNSTHNDYMGVFDTYASGMYVQELPSGIETSGQPERDAAVLYAIGVVPSAAVYSPVISAPNIPSGNSTVAPQSIATDGNTYVNPASVISGQVPTTPNTPYVAVVPASVSFIHPNIIDKFENAGIQSVSHIPTSPAPDNYKPDSKSNEPQGLHSDSSTGFRNHTESPQISNPVEISRFNKTYVSESAVVSSAYLGNDEQIRSAIQHKVAETGSLSSVIRNGVSFDEQNAFAHKVLVSDIATSTTISEQAITHIAEVARENQSTITLPLKNGQVMVFEGTGGELRNEYKISLQTAVDGDYSKPSTRLLFSSDPHETDAVNIGNVYHAYAKGMDVDRPVSVSTGDYQQQLNDKQVLYAIGAVSKDEIAISKDGLMSVPKNTVYVNDSVLKLAQSKGASTVLIDNQVQTISEVRSKRIPLPKNEVSESVYLGNYESIKKITHTGISENFKETYVTQPERYHAKPMSSASKADTASSAASAKSKNITVIPRSVASGKKATVVAVLAGTPNSQHSTADNKINDNKSSPAKTASDNKTPQNGVPTYVPVKTARTPNGAEPAKQGTYIATAKSGTRVAVKTPVVQSGNDVVIKTKYGYNAIHNNGGARKVNIQLLGTASQTASLLKPAQKTGVEAQAARANVRVAAYNATAQTFVDKNGRVHIRADHNTVKRRVEFSKYFTSNRQIVSASQHKFKVTARVKQGGQQTRKIVAVRAYRANADIQEALRTRDFSQVLKQVKTTNSKVPVTTSGGSRFAPIIVNSEKEKELLAKQADAKGAMVVSLFRQFSRMSGLSSSSSNNYTIIGFKALFGYSSPLNIALDFASASAAADELYNFKTAMMGDLLKDDMNALMPDLTNGLDLTKLKGRGQLRKGIADLSKKSFGTDITRFSSYKIKEILKDGKYKGVALTNEQRKQLVATLRLQGFKYRDFSVFDITDNLRRKGINISGTFNLNKKSDVENLLAELNKYSGKNFSLLLNGMSFKDLSTDQIKALAQNLAGNVPEELQALAATYLAGNELLSKINEKKIAAKARFSRVSILLRKLMGNSYAGAGLNLILNAYEYIRLAKLINKVVFPAVKRIYNKTLGKVIKKLKSIYNKTLGKAIRNAKAGIRSVIHSTKFYKRAHSASRLARANVNMAKHRVKRVLNKGKSAVRNTVQAGKSQIKRGIRNTVNKNAKLKKISGNLKTANKARRTIASKAKSKLKNVGMKLKRVGHTLAKPFKIVMKPLSKLAKLKSAASLAVIKFAAIGLAVLAAIVLLAAFIMSVTTAIQGIIWNYEEIPIIGEIIPVDRNGNGVDDREEDNLDLTVFYHNDGAGRVVNASQCDNCAVNAAGSLVCMGHANSESTLMYDRVEYCIGMDSALKVYTEVMCDANNYESALFTGTKNTAIDEVLDCAEVKAEEKSWYDPHARKHVNIQNLGCKINGVQTGIHYSYYDGDGNEIGLQSNAKDIVAVASTWQYDNYKAKGLFKSYVEKLWCYSHAVTYMPRSYGGKFIYKCDLNSSSSPCYNNTYDWYCNWWTSNIYELNAPHRLQNVQANVKLFNDDGSEVWEYKYKANGCKKHTFTYCGYCETIKGKDSGITYAYCPGHCDDCKEKEKVSHTVSKQYYKTTYHANNAAGCNNYLTISSTSVCTNGCIHAWEVCGKNTSTYYNLANYTYAKTNQAWTLDDGCLYYIFTRLDANGNDEYYLCPGHTTTTRKCRGHSTLATENITYDTYKCKGYCPGHKIKYCSGHIDLDISVVTLFLDDNNGLTKLGVPRKVTSTFETHKTNKSVIAPFLNENMQVIVQKPVLPGSLSANNIESTHFLYTHVDKFKTIKRNIGSGTLLPLPDPDYIKDGMKLKLSEIQNVQLLTNQTIDTLRFLWLYTQGKYPYGEAFRGYKNLDELVGSYFSKFATHAWQDTNDQGSVDGVVGQTVDIQHYAGIYSKFGKKNVFEGWYNYDESGNIVKHTNSEGKVEYADYGNVSRAEGMISDSWKEIYNIDFPGAIKGAITKEDMAILQNLAQQLHGARAGNIANRILNSLPHEGPNGDVIGATNYPKSPRSNINYVKDVYSLSGLTPAYGNVPASVNDKDAVKWLYSNNKTQQFSGDRATAKQTVANFRTGDLILIGDEIYMVLYNTGHVLGSGQTHYPVGKEDVEEGTIVVATVAGGGTPRLLAYRCETFFDNRVGFGYIKCNY